MSATALSACSNDAGQVGTTTSANDFTLWNGTFAAYGKGTNTDKGKNDYWLAKALASYEADHGITITVNNSVDGPDLLTKIRTSGVARQGPDLATVWGASYLMGVKDFFTPLDDYYPPDKRKGIFGWEANTDGFVEGKGKLYAVPCGTDALTCLYYNTKVLDKAGVAIDTAAVSEWDSFISMLDKIKSTGVTPLAMFAGSYLYFSLMYWIAQNIGGTPGVIDLQSGKRQFSSPEIRQAVDGWLSLVPFTHAGAPVLTRDDVLKLLLTGKAAVAPGLAIADLREGLGEHVTITKLPNIRPDAPILNSGIGGPGQAFAIPAAAKHVDDAVAFIDYLNSKDQQLARAKLGEGPLPNLPDLAGLNVYTDPLAQTIAEWSTGDLIYWPDNLLDARLVAHLAAQTQLVWNGNIGADQFLESLDKKRDEIASG